MPDGQRALGPQDIFQEVPKRCCQEDATIPSPDTRAMEPFGAAAGGLALIGGVVKTASAVKTTCSDYQLAEKDGQHVQRQKELLRINQSLLESHQVQTPYHFDGINNAFKEVATALNSQPCLDKKKDKVVWVLGGKRKAQDNISKLKEIESSMGVTLQLKAHDQLESYNKSLQKMWKHILKQEDGHSSDLRKLEEAHIRNQRQLEHFSAILTRPQILPEQQLAARNYHCRWMLCIGIYLHLVLFRDGSRSIHAISLSFPLLYMIFTLRLGFMSGWPRCPQFSLRRRIEIQTDSEIIRACQQNNIPLIQELLANCGALVNCTTPDNLTPLRFAIRAGDAKNVKLLLDSGADPNQTFGAFDTSPLNNAFLVGSIPIIRLLLFAGADLYHLNSRAWTCLYYLWDPDPHLQHPSVTCQILAICSGQGFMGWEFRDSRGWALIHRAAAFGHPDHIKKLFNMRVISREVIPVTFTNWSPIQCAAAHGNLPTFEYLVEKYDTSPSELREMRDNRGWNLVHLAAASGSEEMIVYLVSLGVDPSAESDPADLWMIPELMYKSLTPREIADAYGYGQEYDDATWRFASTISTENCQGNNTKESQKDSTSPLSNSHNESNLARSCP